MTQTQVVHVLNKLQYKGITDWENNIGEEKQFTESEARLIATRLLREEQLKRLVMSYLTRYNGKVVLDMASGYFRAVTDREYLLSYVWQQRNDTEEILPVEGNLSLETIYDYIISRITRKELKIHSDQYGLMIREKTERK